MNRRKLLILILLTITVGALIILSAGLSGVTLLPGQALPWAREAERLLAGTEAPPGNRLLEALIRMLFVLAQLLLPLAIIYFFLSREARRRVLRGLGFLLWIIALYFLISRNPQMLQQLEPVDISPPDDIPYPEDLPEFSPTPPPWLITVTTISLALLSAAVLVGVARYIWLRSRPPSSPLEKLAQEAEEALSAIQAGADIKDTVLRCYYEMSRVLQEQQGIRRKKGMTPREFEQQLTEAGLPGEYVRQLTRLFERVRYGAKMADEEEEQQAVRCLTAIVDAARSIP